MTRKELLDLIKQGNFLMTEDDPVAGDTGGADASASATTDFGGDTASSTTTSTTTDTTTDTTDYSNDDELFGDGPDNGLDDLSGPSSFGGGSLGGHGGEGGKPAPIAPDVDKYEVIKFISTDNDSDEEYTKSYVKIRNLKTGKYEILPLSQIDF